MWQGTRDADEQGGQDQEGGEVHCHDRLEEEVLEEVGGIDDGEDEDGGEVDGEDGAHQSSSQHKYKFDPIVMVFGVDKIQLPKVNLVGGHVLLQLTIFG